MTRPDPHAPGESRGSVFGRTLVLICAGGLFLAVASLAANLADRIGASL